MKSIAAILLAAGVIGVATAAAPPGSDPCTDGPSYWCASPEQALECDFALDECAPYCADAAANFLEDSEVCKQLGVGNDGMANDGALGGNDGFANDGFGNDGFANEGFGGNEGAANDGMIVGGDPCTWGPSHWCSSMKVLEECGMDAAECADYCENTVEYPDLAESDVCIEHHDKA